MKSDANSGSKGLVPETGVAPDGGEGLSLAGLLLGLFLGLSLLKFGNPVVLDHMVEPPTDWVGFVFQPWPVRWGYFLFGIVTVILFWLNRLNWKKPTGWVWLPLIWFGWQVISAGTTVHPELTRQVLAHFLVCTVCFYLGYCFLSRRDLVQSITLPLLIAFGWVIWMGMDQHFGGLAATRAEFYKQNPDITKFPAEFIKKINSNRIFSTLVYPNALAGAVLLFLPSLTFFIWDLLAKRRKLLAWIGVVGLFAGGVGCLVWSESKAGWLLSLIVVAVAGLNQALPKRLKIAFIVGFLVVGTVVFAVRFRAYFSKGATSVGARFDYWRAAGQNIASRPVFGSGPGTFAVIYARLKSPDSEMARLAHNDYLQQASDSGIPGALFFLGLFPVQMYLLYRKCRVNSGDFWIWLGLLGWTLQGMVEFGLYIPALSWVAFFWLGWLMGVPGIRASDHPVSE